MACCIARAYFGRFENFESLMRKTGLHCWIQLNQVGGRVHVFVHSARLFDNGVS